MATFFNKGFPFVSLILTIAVGLSKSESDKPVSSWPGSELPNESLSWTEIKLNRKGDLFNSVAMTRKAWPFPGTGGTGNNRNMAGFKNLDHNSNIPIMEQISSKNQNLGASQFLLPQGIHNFNTAAVQSQSRPHSPFMGGFVSTSVVSTPGGGFIIQTNNGDEDSNNSVPPPQLCPGFPFCGSNGAPFCPGFPFCGGTPFCPGFPFCRATATAPWTKNMKSKGPVNFAPWPNVPVMNPIPFIGNVFKTIEGAIPVSSASPALATNLESNGLPNSPGFLPYGDPRTNAIETR